MLRISRQELTLVGFNVCPCSVVVRRNILLGLIDSMTNVWQGAGGGLNTSTAGNCVCRTHLVGTQHSTQTLKKYFTKAEPAGGKYTWLMQPEVRVATAGTSKNCASTNFGIIITPRPRSHSRLADDHVLQVICRFVVLELDVKAVLDTHFHLEGIQRTRLLEASRHRD